MIANPLLSVPEAAYQQNADSVIALARTPRGLTKLIARRVRQVERPAASRKTL